MTRAADLPDGVYLVIDRDHDTGSEWFDLWGETHGDVPVIRVVRAATAMEPRPRCEGCRAVTASCYRLAADDAGVPACRECITEYEWVEGVVDGLELATAASAGD